jgi:prepilin-type N-terminal cleavage/methylation domain-containing protein
MQLKKYKKIQGFTLIELLVSIALFSVVLTVALGSIMTIADSNKKARSLMSVTNNLNFAVDSMIRSFKTGDVTSSSFVFNDGDCFTTQEINYSSTGFDTREVSYCFREDPATNLGSIKKSINGGTEVPLTSPDVDVDGCEFINSSLNTSASALTSQPMLTIVMHGTVKVSERIDSAFSIQTSISQRKLKI